MDMDVIERDNGSLRVALAGRLDTVGVDRVETRFNAAVVSRGKPALVDLSGVDFVSSMGIRMLITAARALRSRGSVLLLCVPAGPVRELLHTAALDALIPMFEQQDEALAQLDRL